MDPLAIRVAALYERASEQELLEQIQRESQDVLKQLDRHGPALAKLLDWVEDCQRLLRSNTLQETLDHIKEFQSQCKEAAANLKRLLREDSLPELRRGLQEISRELEEAEKSNHLVFLEEELWESTILSRLTNKIDSVEDIAGSLKDLSEWGI